MNEKNAKKKHCLTVKVGVNPILEIGSRTEVNQLELHGLEIDQEIFILDIPMNDS